ncbi:MAG: hypothetical protein RL684_2846, partial [Pseudomonadota bacterium]
MPAIVRPVAFALLSGLLAALPQTSAAFDWQPVLPAELAMTAEPKAPGAPAICLYRQVERFDNDGSEKYYVRIKILAEAGRKYSDVEIPYYKSSQWV